MSTVLGYDPNLIIWTKELTQSCSCGHSILDVLHSDSIVYHVVTDEHAKLHAKGAFLREALADIINTCRKTGADVKFNARDYDIAKEIIEGI